MCRKRQLAKKRVRFTLNDQVLGSWMTHRTSYFIKEEAHDHSLVKLAMSF